MFSEGTERDQWHEMGYLDQTKPSYETTGDLSQWLL